MVLRKGSNSFKRVTPWIYWDVPTNLTTVNMNYIVDYFIGILHLPEWTVGLCGVHFVSIGIIYRICLSSADRI